jgi:predicted acetyltransferase
LEFNAYEFSRLEGSDVDRQGIFGYRYLEHYWIEPARHPYLIEVEGHIAGIVLLRIGQPSEVAEFLVLPKYRRCGVGTAAAHAAFALFAGDWEVHEVAGHDSATAFWRDVIPVPFEETVDTNGTTQRFSLPSR